jgi:hypothetical protein
MSLKKLLIFVVLFLFLSNRVFANAYREKQKVDAEDPRIVFAEFFD